MSGGESPADPPRAEERQERILFRIESRGARGEHALATWSDVFEAPAVPKLLDDCRTDIRRLGDGRCVAELLADSTHGRGDRVPSVRFR